MADSKIVESARDLTSVIASVYQEFLNAGVDTVEAKAQTLFILEQAQRDIICTETDYATRQRLRLISSLNTKELLADDIQKKFSEQNKKYEKSRAAAIEMLQNTLEYLK